MTATGNDSCSQTLWGKIVQPRSQLVRQKTRPTLSIRRKWQPCHNILSSMLTTGILIKDAITTSTSTHLVSYPYRICQHKWHFLLAKCETRWPRGGVREEWYYISTAATAKETLVHSQAGGSLPWCLWTRHWGRKRKHFFFRLLPQSQVKKHNGKNNYSRI